MTPDEMEALIGAHLRAEGNGDADGAVANYTEDVEHDVVGFPGSPLRGISAALEFYRQLVKEIRTDGEERLHLLRRRRGGHREPDDRYRHWSVSWHSGNGKQVRFRVLHVFEFRDDRISRENVWLDGAAVAAQLTS